MGSAIHNKFRMDAAKRLRDMAVPADRQMCPERSLKILRGDVLPFDGPIVFVKQSGGMVVPMDFVEWFVTIDTFLAGIPPIHDGVNEARLWGFFDLRKALLATGFTFRPARTLA